MEFSFSEEQLALRELAAKIFSARANDETLRNTSSDGEWIDRALWRELGAASLIGLTLSEEHGGAGMGLLDLCIVLEEQGRCLAPVPLLQTALLGAWPAAHGLGAAATELLVGVSRGERIATAALDELGGFDVRRPRTAARRAGGDVIVSGVKECVPYAHVADWVLVGARADDGVAVLAVDPRSAGCALERQQTVNYEPQFRLHLDGVRVPAERVVAAPGKGDALLGWLEERALVGLAALQVGICEEALRRTASYTSERVQFGRPIGAFQGVALRAADSYMAVEAMRSTMWQAAWRIDRGLPAQVECHVAKWWAARGGQEVVHTAQHLHGGLGADIDYPIHRYFLWAKQIGMALGGEARQLQKLGSAMAAEQSDE